MDESYPDAGLADDLARGFDLVGELPQSGGVLPLKLVPATLAMKELAAGAHHARQALQVTVTTCGDAGMDKELYEKTLNEAERG